MKIVKIAAAMSMFFVVACASTEQKADEAPAAAPAAAAPAEAAPAATSAEAPAASTATAQSLLAFLRRRLNRTVQPLFLLIVACQSPRGLAPSLPQQDGRRARHINQRGRGGAAFAAQGDSFNAFFQLVCQECRVGDGFTLTWQDHGCRQQWCSNQLKQALGDRVIGNPQPDGLFLWVLQFFGYIARGWQDECKRPGSFALQNPVVSVTDQGILGYL